MGDPCEWASEPQKLSNLRMVGCYNCRDVRTVFRELQRTRPGPTDPFAYPGSETGRWGGLAAATFSSSPSNISVRTIPTRRLGGSRRALAALRTDQVDIVLMNGYQLADNIPEFGIFVLPFFIDNIASARRLIQNTDQLLRSPVARARLAIHGYVWSVGTFVSADDCLSGPSQLEGRRIAGGYRQHHEVFREARATPINFGNFKPVPVMTPGVGFFSLDYILRARLWRSSRCLTGTTDIYPRLTPYAIVSSADQERFLSQELSEQFKQFERTADVEERQRSKTVDRYYRRSGRLVRNMDGDSLSDWRDTASAQYTRFQARHSSLFRVGRRLW